MTESVFKDTLLRMARFSDYEKKDELLGLLKRVYITFNKTNIFTRKSWQFYEDVELRISPEYKKLLEKHEKILSEWCYEIYEGKQVIIRIFKSLPTFDKMFSNDGGDTNRDG